MTTFLPDFFAALGRLTSFAPSPSRLPRPSVEEALEADMRSVGGDLRRVMDRHRLG